MTEDIFCNKFLKAVQCYVKFTHCSRSVSKLWQRMQHHTYNILGCYRESAEESHWIMKGKESDFKL